MNRRAYPHDSRYWQYEMLDFSEEIVTALMYDRHVHATLGVITEETVPRTVLFVEFPEATQLMESGSFGTHVSVRWNDSVSTVQRIELEKRYHLRDLDENLEWIVEYILGDPTQSNVRALLEEFKYDERLDPSNSKDRMALQRFK